MKKQRYATSREVRSAREILNKKTSEIVLKKFGECPSYEEDRLWMDAHPSPIKKYRNKTAGLKELLSKRKEELIFKADMKQISADELFEMVVNFK